MPWIIVMHFKPNGTQKQFSLHYRALFPHSELLLSKKALRSPTSRLALLLTKERAATTLLPRWTVDKPKSLLPVLSLLTVPAQRAHPGATRHTVSPLPEPTARVGLVTQAPRHSQKDQV